MEKQAVEAQRRLRVYRGSRPPQDFEDKDIILVDGMSIEVHLKQLRNLATICDQALFIFLWALRHRLDLSGY